MFNHSSRVYYFAALAGIRKELHFDRELLYAGAMSHDLGLMPGFSTMDARFEVDGANAAREFLTQHGVDPVDITHVYTAIALHTTPGIPQHMHPVIALVTAGVEMDVLGIDYGEFDDAEREEEHKPETTFGNVKADVLADKDSALVRGNLCSAIRNSALA